ncbi:Flp family type IVb pilin [Hyphomicrobiales bacterium]|nr:Flp family type IVb pilin [Hyphomicrobiales bacterium]CAH1700995.1 Flp family type IVb pilin [Hyphomicrobiales bacterium]CAI0344873.1 pilus assembly protein Flp/PilA [Hyphomicrobiales bacterium]
MKQIAASLAGLLRDERGATAIEYAFIASLVSIVIVSAVTLIGTRLSALTALVLPGLK